MTLTSGIQKTLLQCSEISFLECVCSVCLCIYFRCVILLVFSSSTCVFYLRHFLQNAIFALCQNAIFALYQNAIFALLSKCNICTFIKMQYLHFYQNAIFALYRMKCNICTFLKNAKIEFLVK